MNESCVENVKVQQVPSDGRQAISYVSVTHVLYCLVLSCLSCFLYIYKHNYRAMVLGKEGYREVQDCKFCFGPKEDSKRDEPPNIPSNRTKQFLDPLPLYHTCCFDLQVHPGLKI